MRKLNLMALVAVLSLSFFSCDREEIVEFEQFETEQTLTAQTRSVTDMFQTIDDLRAAGVSVSRRLDNRVNNDLQTLLNAAELSTTRAGRRQLRRQGFNGRLIRQLRRIASQIEALEAADPTDPCFTNCYKHVW